MVSFTADTSERALLGAAMASVESLHQIRRVLDPEDFWQPRYARLFEMFCELDDFGVTPDLQVVNSELNSRGQLHAWRNGVELVEIWEHSSGNGTVNWHIDQVRQTARLRKVREEHTRLGQFLEEASDPDALLDYAAKSSVSLALAADEAHDGEIAELTSWRRFLDNRPPGDRWIVPGFLRIGDAVLLLSAPGAGKSTISRQVALCLAAGIHPFRPEVRIRPVRTLLIDIENAEDQLAEETDPMYARIETMSGGFDPDFAKIWPHQQGFNLRTRAGARLLERAIVQARPQVLLMGSLFQAYRRGRDDWDTAAEEVQDVLRVLRARYGLAYWLEHHSTRGASGGHSQSPFGGTAWERWPTHGRWLARVNKDRDIYTLGPTFRGDRGRRDIPPGLIRGEEDDPWWTSIWDKDEVEFMGNGGEPK